MTGKAIIMAILAVFLMTSTSWAFGGGGAGGVGVGSPVELLLPDPPRNVTATPGKGMATVNFEPPKSDGGSPVTYYTVTSVPRGIVIKGTKSPMTVQGLSDQRCYSFVVTASNSVGTGLASHPSKCVTPSE